MSKFLEGSTPAPPLNDDPALAAEILDASAHVLAVQSKTCDDGKQAVRIGVTVPIDLHDRLQLLAAQRGLTVPAFLRFLGLRELIRAGMQSKTCD
jgi:hypothetical protein